MILLPAVGLVLTVITVYVGGTLQRYVVDFFWMFSTLSMIIWSLMYQNADEKFREKIFRILLILVLISIFTNFYGTFLSSEFDYLRKRLPEQFEFYEKLLNFVDFN